MACKHHVRPTLNGAAGYAYDHPLFSKDQKLASESSLESELEGLFVNEQHVHEAYSAMSSMNFFTNMRI